MYIGQKKNLKFYHKNRYGKDFLRNREIMGLLRLPNNAVNKHPHTDNSNYAIVSHNLDVSKGFSHVEHVSHVRICKKIKYFALEIAKNVKMHHFGAFYTVFGRFSTVWRKFSRDFGDINF